MNLFIAQTSDPIYWSVIANVLLKSIFQRTKRMTEQDEEIIRKKINALGELSQSFISIAYNIDQAKTVEFVTEARIGGYSIIGKFRIGAIRHVQFQLIIF